MVVTVYVDAVKTLRVNAKGIRVTEIQSRDSVLLLMCCCLLPAYCGLAHIVQLMKQGGGDDEQLCSAWGKVGAYYTERGKWGKAVQYFKQAKDLGMMAECYYR